MFDPYLRRWALVADGDPIVTPTSRLLPVSLGERKAMLKIALIEEERVGGSLMGWWAGDGAAAILAQDGNAFLMERAVGTASLSTMASAGHDEAACAILCGTAARLHAVRPEMPPLLVPLERWFDPLGAAAARHGGILARCETARRMLLETQEDILPLHGDLHHDNVLDFGPRGWLAIDPKGLLGERGFDFANLFCNPDMDFAVQPDRFLRRLAVVSEQARLERTRLLLWIVAWSGLSTAFSMEGGSTGPFEQVRLAELAGAELGR